MVWNLSGIEPKAGDEWERAVDQAKREGQSSAPCTAIFESEDNDGGQRVQLALDVVDRSDLGPGVTELHCWSVTVERLGDRPFEGSDFAEIPLPELLSRAQEGAVLTRTHRGQVKFMAELTALERQKLEERWRARARTPRRGEPVTLEQLDHVSELYSHRLAVGSRRPTQDVADMLDVPRSTVARWLVDARKRGLLTQRGRGRYS